ncbi:MAG: hypothetical protein ACYDD1_16765 [Caulobacteraceae bacterium]
MSKLIVLLPSLAALACVGCATHNANLAPASQSASGGQPPHIDSVTFKDQPYASDLVQPEIHFHAVNGDVRLIREEVVESTGPAFKLEGGPIEASAAKQKAGAVYSKDLRCGPGAYRVKVRAYLVDRAGDHSNTVGYTIHCNGG